MESKTRSYRSLISHSWDLTIYLHTYNPWVACVKSCDRSRHTCTEAQSPNADRIPLQPIIKPKHRFPSPLLPVVMNGRRQKKRNRLIDDRAPPPPGFLQRVLPSSLLPSPANASLLRTDVEKHCCPKKPTHANHQDRVAHASRTHVAARAVPRHGDTSKEACS